MLRRVAIPGASSARIIRLRSTTSSLDRRRHHQLLSTLQAINPQHFRLQQQQFAGLPPCRIDDDDDDDDDQQKKADRNNNTTIFHSSLASSLIHLNNTPAIGTKNGSSMQHNNNNCSTITITRQYHTTLPEQRGVAIVLSLGAVAATAKAGQYAVQGYKEWKVAMEEERRLQELEEKNNPPKEEDATHKTTQEEEAKSESSTGSTDQSAGSAGQAKKEAKRENFFAKFFNLSVGSKYYEGGFEEKMTRKEAALILGVRESSTAKRIKEAHRKLLILNHPDTGGSTYMAGKINEAKELLLKGKK